MALYTKVKGDVNYTEVGSPMIVNGVVSGFSTNNYLTTPVFSPGNKPWEMVYKFTTGSSVSSQYGIVTNLGTDDSIAPLYIGSNSTLQFFLSSNGSSWNIATNKQILILQSNTTYIIKLEFTGNAYNAYSFENNQWILKNTVTSSTPIYGGISLVFGNNRATSYSFNGSIDLNETYIKIGDTVWFGNYNYKVKVRTGLTKYTVVGNPTIENGIASDFSANDYLKSNSVFPANTTTSFEFATKINLSSIASTSCIASSTSSIIPFHLNIRDGKALLYPGVENVSKYSSFVFSTNTDYWVKVCWDSSGWSFKYSTDGITYITDFSEYSKTTVPHENYVVIGRNYVNGGSEPFLGSIDLNASYIKINNGYFWRGSHQNINAWKIQQDNFSKYYTIVDGKLTWANPDIYLQSSGTQYINSNYKPNALSKMKIKYQTPSQTTSQQGIFGARNNNSDVTNRFTLFTGTVQNGLQADYGSNSSLCPVPYNENITGFNGLEINTIEMANYLSINGEIVKSISQGSFQSTNNLYLFANNNGSVQLPMTGKIFYSKLWNNNSLIRHFVPVPKGLLIGNFVVPSNGMFDIVEQKFYGNQGTGEFEIGGIPQDYIIEGGRMLWCNPNIYLESTGTQYINSNFVPTNYSKWVLDAQFTDTSINSWNGRYNTSSSPQRFDIALSSNTYVINGGNTTNFNGILTADTNRHIFILDMINEKGIIDNTYEIDLSTVTMTSTKTVKIFARQGGSSIESYCREKIYSSQFYEKQTIEQYLVPVPKGMLIGDKIAPSNCMFDLVTQTFFTNQGTGDFIIGGISGDYINIGDNIVWVNENVYLKSTRTQYIDTNYKPNNNTCLDYYVKFTGSFNNSGNVTFCGCRNSDETQWFSFNFGGNANQYSQIFNWVVPYVSTSYSLTNSDYNTKQNMSITLTQAIWGTQTKNLPATRNCNTNVPVLIYGYYSSIGPKAFEGYDMQIYNYFKITEGTKIMRYFLPVNTNTVIGSFTVPAPGMWDAVTKKFYPNKGSGSFTYGKDS